MGLDFIIPLWLNENVESFSIDETNVVLSLSIDIVVHSHKSLPQNRRAMRTRIGMVALWVSGQAGVG